VDRVLLVIVAVVVLLLLLAVRQAYALDAQLKAQRAEREAAALSEYGA
jgi:putative copper export protein